MKHCFNVLLIGCVFLFAGCANDSTDDLSAPIEGLVTYQANVQNIFNNNCVSCHGAVMPSGGLSLHNYEAARAAVESGMVIARMTDNVNPMPPSGLLPSSTVEVIQQWIADGFLEE